MSFWTLLVISCGVAADAFAVAIGKGLQSRSLNLRRASALALTFGAFQAGMTLLGWLLGDQLRQFITDVDHWLAFGLLAAIGGRMIWKALREPSEELAAAPPSWRELVVLGIATSIDALAVGIGFAFLQVSITQAALLIGVVTLALSYLGVLVGYHAGRRYQRPAEVAGGLILIAIGTKVLLDHTGVL